MTTTWQKFAETDIAEPTVSDEQQDLLYDSHHKVLVTDCSFTITTDHIGAFIGSKVHGHGFHVTNNGDMYSIAGPKALGGGKLITVSRGGQLTKTGTVIVERKKSNTHVTAEDGEAYNELNFGDWITETHGTVTIKGTNIVIDATDSLTLKAGDKLLIESGETKHTTGKSTLNSGFEYKTITSKRQAIISEDVLYQYDPRATNHIISAGHINRRIGGDHASTIGGVEHKDIKGLPPLPPSPGLVFPPQRYWSSLTSVKIGGISISAVLGVYDVKAGLMINQDAGSVYSVKTGGLTSIVSGGNIGITSPMGVGIVGGLPSLPSFVPGKVTVKGTTGVDIDSDLSINVRAKTNLSLEGGTMIYLN